MWPAPCALVAAEHTRRWCWLVNNTLAQTYWPPRGSKTWVHITLTRPAAERFHRRSHPLSNTWHWQRGIVDIVELIASQILRVVMITVILQMRTDWMQSVRRDWSLPTRLSEVPALSASFILVPTTFARQLGDTLRLSMGLQEPLHLNS